MFDFLLDFVYDHPMLISVLGFVLVFYIPIGLLGYAASCI